MTYRKPCRQQQRGSCLDDGYREFGIGSSGLYARNNAQVYLKPRLWFEGSTGIELNVRRTNLTTAHRLMAPAHGSDIFTEGAYINSRLKICR